MLIVYAYLIAIFIRPQDWMRVFFAWPIVDVLIGAGLAAAVFAWAEGKTKVRFPVFSLIIWYLVVIFMSNLMQGNMPMAVEFFIFHLKRTASFLMLIFLLNSSDKLKKAINFFVFLSVLLVFQGIYQKIHGIGIAGQPLVQDVRICWVGMWDGPNVLALVFVLAAVFSLNDFLDSPRVFPRIISAVSFLLLSYGIYLTNSRGGFLSLLLCVFLSFVFKVKNKAKAVIFGTIICLGVLVLAAPSRMGHIQGESSAQERSWTWEVALTLSRANPLLGIGKGVFQKDYGWVAHNNFVQVMVETGVSGLFLFVSIMYMSFKGLKKVCLEKENKLVMEKEREIVNIAGMLIIALIVFNACTFFITMELEILYILLAFCFAPLAIIKMHKPDFEVNFNKRDFLAVTASMIVIVFIVALISLKNLV